MNIILCLLIDRWWGEPPARIHPVVWMGKYLNWAGRGLPNHRPWISFLLGTLFWLLGAGATVLLYHYAETAIAKYLPWWLGIIATSLLLKPLLALRLLLAEVRAVEQALEEGLDSGRAQLRRIVSRDTSKLDVDQIRESMIETLTENVSDSVVAPLLWFALFGLPGAAVYRFANTADAMWGYRGSWEWAGKFTARADDILNLIPARLTGVAILLLGRNGFTLLRRLPREASGTPSPNAGWPMSAIALSLGVKLRKPEVYVLNNEGTPPKAADVFTALRRSEHTGWAMASVLAILMQLLPLLGFA